MKQIPADWQGRACGFVVWAKAADNILALTDAGAWELERLLVLIDHLWAHDKGPGQKRRASR